MRKFKQALLIVAPLVLFLVVPAAAQTTTPMVFTGFYPGAGCDPGCAVTALDGDPNTACQCWNMTVCVAEPVNMLDFEILTDWPHGLSIVPKLDGELGYNTRTFLEDPQGTRWFRATNLGQADCVFFSALSEEGVWGDPVIYEIRGTSGDGTMDVFGGSFWMVNRQVGRTLGAELVSRFIYAILGLAIGTLGLAMIIRGLFGAAGAHAFGQGSGLGHSGSGVSYPSSEVGDVD